MKDKILRDCLNIPVCEINVFTNEIFEFGVLKGVKDYYLHSTVGIHEKFTSLDEAKKWADDNGFDYEEYQNGYNHTQLKLKHKKTAAYIKQKISEHDDKWKDAQDCYIRFGDLPKGGMSKNHATGEYEKGISVFCGKCLDNGEAIATPKYHTELLDYFTLKSRPGFLVEGNLIGNGSDGEPLLENVKIIRKIN